MKKLLFAVIVVLLLSSCGESLRDMESEFILKVTGTENTRFSGHYSVMETGATPSPRNVSGTVPAEYRGRGVMALCLFRKVAAEGTLRVEILRDGKKVTESETVNPFGIVSLKTPLPDQDSIINLILKKVLGG